METIIAIATVCGCVAIIIGSILALILGLGTTLLLFDEFKGNRK